MFGNHVYRSGRKVKLAAVAAIALSIAGAGAPAAMALNPQPLPPIVIHGDSQPVLIGGFLTCHEYGCL
jgi:hypothetical protein